MDESPAADAPYGDAVPDIPSDARQLAGAIRDACSKAGERVAHASLPGQATGQSGGVSV